MSTSASSKSRARSRSRSSSGSSHSSSSGSRALSGSSSRVRARARPSTGATTSSSSSASSSSGSGVGARSSSDVDDLVQGVANVALSAPLLFLGKQTIQGFTSYPGELKLREEGDTVQIPFTRVQNVVHDLDFFFDKMSTPKGLVLRGKKANDSRRYSGEPLFWFAPQVPKEKQKEHVPSLAGNDSRYGYLHISIDWNTLLALLEARWGKEPRWFNLGTREYKQEWCHSLLLSPHDAVRGCGQTTNEYPAFELDAASLPVGTTEQTGATRTWTWTMGRHASEAWDQLDFALHLSEPLVVPWSAVQLSFVAHKGFCVPSKRPAQDCLSKDIECSIRKFASAAATVAAPGLTTAHATERSVRFHLLYLKVSLAHQPGLYRGLRRSARTLHLIRRHLGDWDEHASVNKKIHKNNEHAWWEQLQLCDSETEEAW